MAHGRIKKDPEAVRAIIEMPLPKTARELRSQLGIFGRYRDMVPYYAQMATELETMVTTRWKPGTFKPRHKEMIESIRRCIARETLLIMPDWNRDMHWWIDAQPTEGWAGVVGQVDKKGRFWPLQFFSKKPTEAEKKMFPTEAEAVAWVYCLMEKGQHYARNSRNIIHGDPLSLRWLQDAIVSGRASGRMHRAALALQSLNILFQYHPRAEMEHVDAISRFQADVESSVEELEAFLATDEPLGKALVAAAATKVERELPARMKDPNRAIALAVVGADSPPGVPVDIVEEQKRDPVCSYLFKLKSGEFEDEAAKKAFLDGMPKKDAQALRQHGRKAGNMDFNDFTLRGGAVYFVGENRLGRPRLRVVVPWALRARVLTANHDAPAAGHRGFQKTYEALTRDFFWFGMCSDTKAWVASCKPCGAGKRRTIAGHGTAQHQGLVPMHFPPYRRAAIDLIGPIIESREGHEYILVIKDVHSNETKLEALKSRNSEDIANLLLKRVVLSEGCPLEWQTDNAPELTKSAVAKLAKLAGITPKTGLAYEAHVNGAVEKQNWWIMTILRELCKDDLRGWPEKLPWAEFTINSSVYATTGQTPYFHKTGYDPINPQNVWRALDEEVGELATEWTKRMCTSFRFSELAHAQAADRRKEQYDAGKREHGLEPGDKVFLWIQRENKMQHSTIGPLLLKRFLDPQTKRSAVVHPVGVPNEEIVVHVDRLYKHNERPEHLSNIPTDVTDWMQAQNELSQAEMDGLPQVTQLQRGVAQEQQEVWDIDAIVDRRENRAGDREYFVKFTGYGEEDNLWYTEQDLRAMGQETIRMLDEFDETRDQEEHQRMLAAKPGQGVRRSTRRGGRLKGG